MQNDRTREAKPTVLVVEDEILVRLAAVEMIRAAGYKTLEADNADTAIALLERQSDIAVIFTDIQMPGSMDGLKLAAAVKDRWPPIRVIATSGNPPARASELPEGGRFIRKPYSIGQVTRVIEEFMAA
jgi:CheY-like chemotaxis protein